MSGSKVFFQVYGVDREFQPPDGGRPIKRNGPFLESIEAPPELMATFERLGLPRSGDQIAFNFSGADSIWVRSVVYQGNGSVLLYSVRDDVSVLAVELQKTDA